MAAKDPWGMGQHLPAIDAPPLDIGSDLKLDTSLELSDEAPTPVVYGPISDQAFSGNSTEAKNPIAYSGMPLNGRTGPYVEFLDTPSDALLGGALPIPEFDVTIPEFSNDPTAGSLNQLAYDSKWLGYAKDMAARKLAADPESIATAQAAYNDAANSSIRGTSSYDPDKVAIANDALNAMIEANGFTPSPPPAPAPVTLDTITVTASVPRNDIQLELAQQDIVVRDLVPYHVNAVLDSDAHATERLGQGADANDGLDPLSKPRTTDGTRPLGRPGQTFNARYKNENGQRPFIKSPISHPSPAESFESDASFKVYGWDSGRHLTSVPIIDQSELPENFSVLTFQSDYGAWAGYEVQGDGLMRLGASVDTTSRFTWGEWNPSGSLGTMDLGVTSSVSASADAKLQFNQKDGSFEADRGASAIGSLIELNGSYKSPELTSQWGSLQFNLNGAFDVVAGGGSYKIGISRINGAYRFTAGAGAAAFLGAKGSVDVSVKPDFEKISNTLTPSIPSQDEIWQTVLPAWWNRR